MKEPYLLVWDLDGTIGNFEKLEKYRENLPTVEARPEIAPALEILSKIGFIHTVLTMATSTYAEIALKATGLRHFFAKVEGQGQRLKGDVIGIANDFGINPKNYAHKIMFIGDRMLFDEPRHSEVIFHLERFALTRPASQLQILVETLLKQGNGSLREGFLSIGRGSKKWYQFAKLPPIEVGVPIQRKLPKLDPLLLLERVQECPVITFENPPNPPATSSKHQAIIDNRS
ncbi:MAG: HAD family hydrolase [Blastocatellia bacterium]|nr:HAD family hydrolase [Blastocatellia bacterium]MBN8724968.1 HAD family hydrolase [Acidobacteriota bacterium]